MDFRSRCLITVLDELPKCTFLRVVAGGDHIYIYIFIYIYVYLRISHTIHVVSWAPRNVANRWAWAWGASAASVGWLCSSIRARFLPSADAAKSWLKVHKIMRRRIINLIVI